jgi:hypothetical protein
VPRSALTRVGIGGLPVFKNQPLDMWTGKKTTPSACCPEWAPKICPPTLRVTAHDCCARFPSRPLFVAEQRRHKTWRFLGLVLPPCERGTIWSTTRPHAPQL